MASGFGVNGGTGRCYGLWLDYTKCLSDAALPKECYLFREDYIECLHHFKEAKRRQEIAAQVEKQQKLKQDSAATSKPSG